MSSTPSPPPSGPPSGPPEFLDSGGWGPPPREPRRTGLRRGLLVGGGVVGLGAVAAGAWAAYAFLSTGPQPAEALPASTLGYASIDLDPSGGQKIEALRTLNKFPAFEDEVGITADDDVRKELVGRLLQEASCEDLDYADDVEPWLGDRAALAAVDLGGQDPDPVVVLQVQDADEAARGLEAIRACGDGANLGWAFDDGWAVLAQSDDTAREVVEATSDGSLADDRDFRRWTEEAGDPGVVTAYAGPAAGAYLADHAGDLTGFGLGGMAADYACSMPADPGSGDGMPGVDSDGCVRPDQPTTALPEDLERRLRDFAGLALTVRFDDGAIELETAGDASVGVPGLMTAGGPADVVGSLPADTGAVLGAGFAEGWFGDLLENLAPYAGEESPEELLAELSDLTGLDLPDDAETLAGDSAALVLGSDLDPEAFFDSADGSQVPVALKVMGDPDRVEEVLDKLREMAGPDAGVLESDADGDTIVIGPNDAYRAEVLEGGGLGDSAVYQDVIREGDRAQVVMFVNLDEFQDAIRDAAGGGDDEVVGNLEPVSGAGLSGWVDDDVAHGVLRVTTD